MAQKGTTVSARLRRRLTRLGPEMSIRRLAKAVAEQTEDARGSSYAAMRAYVGGGVYNPRRDILEAAARVLGCRPEWLIDGEGEETEVEQAARTPGAEPPAIPPDVQSEAERRARNLMMTVVGALEELPVSGMGEDVLRALYYDTLDRLGYARMAKRGYTTPAGARKFFTCTFPRSVGEQREFDVGDVRSDLVLFQEASLYLLHISTLPLHPNALMAEEGDDGEA